MVYSTEASGSVMRADFQAACTELGIEVVAQVGVTSGIDPLSYEGNVTATSLAQAMRIQFEQSNCKVYFLATASIPDTRAALAVANLSGSVGAGYHLIVPSFLKNARSSDPLRNYLHGALTVAIESDPLSPSGDLLWQAWPKDSQEWDSLLSTSTQRLETKSLRTPAFSRQTISSFAYFTWDATWLAAKGVVRGCEMCRSEASSQAELDITCLLAQLRSTTYSGLTGNVTLDAVGDRFGNLAIFNFYSNTTVKVGNVFEEVDTRGATDITIDLDIPSILWSDNSTNLVTGPREGQTPPAPTANLEAAQVQSNDSGSAILLGVLIGVLVLFIGVVMVLLMRAKRHSPAEADFRKVCVRCRTILACSRDLQSWL